MTREEAIENLEFLESCSYVDSFEKTEKEALKMAIEALKTINDIKAEIEHMACRQYEHRLTLDREEVLEVINKHMKEGEKRARD